MGLSGAQLGQALDLLDVGVSADAAALEALALRLQAVNDGQKRSYERAWAGLLKAFCEAESAAADPGAALRALTSPATSDGLVNPVVHRQSRPVRLDPGPFRAAEGRIVVVADGGYRQIGCAEVSDARLVERLAGLAGPHCGAIVELGAGWGRNLAALALRLERPDLRLIAAEQSQSGRDVAARLLQLGGRFRGEAAAFDFYAPDFGFLEGVEEALIFTHAAIEQIAFLPVDFIARLFAACPRAVLALMEPFGWQAQPALARNAVQRFLTDLRDGRDPSAVVEQHRFVLSDEALDLNSAVWALAGRYSMNLLSVIRAAETAGVASIDALDLNWEGRNLFNPYSLAILRPAG
ncbi:MAG: hypothetical protein RIB45_01160 [Marivibrio sp.]|uniref:hypothetical protein n=1 Tax=Marivibrio sp. TaxID=2039719 RepID=UPI0032F0135C